MKRKVLLSCLFIMVVSSVLAVPYASMGNINIPDAYVLPHKMVDVGYTNYFVSDGLTVASAEEAYGNGYELAVTTRVGLFNRAELGIIYTSLKKTENAKSNIMYGNLKIRLINETETMPALAIGAVNLFSGFQEEDMADYPSQYEAQEMIANSPFIVLSKSIVIVTGIPGLNYLETTFHGGMGSGKYQGKGETVKNLQGMFFGVDFRPSRYLGVDIELDSQNINLGIDGYYKNLVLRAGIYELESILGVNNRGTRIALNVGYTFDQFSDIKSAEKRNAVKVAPRQPRQQNYQAQSVEGNSYQQSNTGENPLMKELEEIRKRRIQAEKELDEIRKLLQD